MFVPTDPPSLISLSPQPWGIWLDSDCSMTTHINKTTRSCYASLREIRSIAAPLSFDLRKLLITSFILQRLITTIQLWLVYLQLQRVINAAAKIINNKRKHDHVTPLLHDLSWLRICQRIDYKISSLVFKSLLGHAPSHLSFTRTAQIPARRGLRSATRGSLVKSSARRAILDGRSVDVVGPQIWNRLPPRLPTLIQSDFAPPSKSFSSKKASLYISGLEVLLSIRHSNQTLYRYRYRYIPSRD